MDERSSAREVCSKINGFAVGATAKRYPQFLQRFMKKVEPSPDPTCSCWIWVGAHDSKGYGNVVVPHGFPGAGRSRRMKAHRVAVALFLDVVLGVREGHHHCETRDCVRFDHVSGESRAAHMAEHRPGSAWADRIASECADAAAAREEMIL